MQFIFSGYCRVAVLGRPKSAYTSDTSIMECHLFWQLEIYPYSEDFHLSCRLGMNSLFRIWRLVHMCLLLLTCYTTIERISAIYLYLSFCLFGRIQQIWLARCGVQRIHGIRGFRLLVLVSIALLEGSFCCLREMLAHLLTLSSLLLEDSVLYLSALKLNGFYWSWISRSVLFRNQEWHW